MKLPPLNAVRAFEAAARHNSFRLAAAELFVTPGAISQQVRQLEEHLGASLFIRRPRAVELTAVGREFFFAVTRHLRGIAQAADRVKPRPDTVTLTVVPTFASRWLMPRLVHFTAQYPAVQVRVDASLQLTDFTSDEFDLGIRYGRGNWPGVESTLLFPHTAVPLCSPGYLTAYFSGRTLDRGWRSARLLHENPPDDFWHQWIAAAGLSAIDADGGLYFSHGLLVLSAAIEGQGVALQPLEFVERELASGALVVADPRKIDTGRGYYLVWPRRALRPSVERFRDWVIRESEEAGRAKGLPRGVRDEALAHARANAPTTVAIQHP